VPASAPLGPAAADSPLVGELASVAPSTDALAPARPKFRFRLPATATTARVEVCEDRACTKLVATFDSSGPSVQPPTPLAAGRVFWRVVTSAGATRSRPLRIRVTGSARGAAMLRGLDWNGDGYIDHVHVARDAIELRLGSPRGLRRDPVRLIPPGQSAVVASGGDLDGDGFDDLVIGVPDHVTATSPKDAVHAGAAFVMPGGPHGRAPQSIHVAGAGRLGSSIAVADVDDDGWNDVLVAAEGISLPASATTVPPEATARVFVLRGRPGGLVDPIELARGAEAVQGAGDVGGDGITRVALRIRTEGLECLTTTGGVNVIDVSVHGGGNSLLVAPDLDGDGRDDLLYGDLIVRDAAGGMQIWRTLPHAVTRVAGDFDGDGRFELASLALGGGLDVFDRDSLASGVTPARRIEAVAGTRLDAGDFNGDGFDDLVVEADGAEPIVIAGSTRGLAR
jgi:hypothetical protein